MQGTMVWDNTQGFIDTEKFRPSAFAMGLGYGRALSDNFSLGGQLKKAYQYLGENVVPITDSSKVLNNNVSSAIAFDFINFKTLIKNSNFSVLNLFTPNIFFILDFLLLTS